MKALLKDLIAGRTLNREQSEHAFTLILTGTADPHQTAALLALLASRQPTVDELLGAATVMRRHVTSIAAPPDVIDTCGTGGTSSTLFNVSTTAALVAAAAGAKVAKHGNRAITSRSGSSDVLALLGVNIHATPTQQATSLTHANICFAFAADHHPAMKHVAPIRQSLGFSTLFNTLGPLTNPAHAKRQLIGTKSPQLADTLLQVLLQLGGTRLMLVNGTDPLRGPLCELSTTGPSYITQFDGATITTTKQFNAQDLHLPLATIQPLEISTPQESATLIQKVLKGEPGPARDIVLLNAAAALWTAARADTLAAALPLAAHALDSGAAAQTLEKLIHFSHA